MKILVLMAALFATVAVTRAAGAQPPGGLAGQAPTAADGEIADQDLDCRDDDVGEALHESRALRAAPKGSKRISAHVLAVHYKSGVRRFIDPRPYREELDGIHWEYCAYLPALRAHLIGVQDGSLFSGRKLWVGDSGFKRDENIVLIYEEPRWISNDALQVVAICNNSSRTRGQATLVRAGKAWLWQSDFQCDA